MTTDASSAVTTGEQTKMDAALKAKWIEALRSGKYRQTKGTLRDGDEFCCLGVLCDLSSAGNWGDPSGYGDRPGIRRYYLGKGIYSVTYFPPTLKSRYGFDDSILDPLMDMNDTGKSFSEIADYIEKNL